MSAATSAPVATSVSQGYFTQPADPCGDRERILALWSAGLGQNGKPEAKHDWYYANHPAGCPRVFFLCHRDAAEPVGIASISCRHMRDGTRAFDAGFLADFVVAPAHRSFFPALFLQKEMRRHGLLAYPLLFGLPNPQSEAIVKRAGYKRIGEMTRYVHVVRTGAYLARHVPRPLGQVLGAFADPLLRARDAVRASADPRYAQAWAEMPDAAFDGLWERCAAAGLMLGERSARFLAWRFSQSPFGTHRFFSLRDAASGRLVAYAACRHGAETLAVEDFLCDPADPRASATLLHALFHEAYRHGASSVSVECLAPEAVVAPLIAAGMVPRERIPVFATFANATDEAAAARWFVTLADEDA